MPWGLERLSEETLELNFASHLNHQCGGTLLWFGLTQKQEAGCGFDIATRFGSALFIVQMKASEHVLKASDARKSKVPDDQLQQLRVIKVTGCPLPKRSIVYAFPVIGTVGELAAHSDVVANTWLCDVADCGAVGAPNKSDGTPRKDGCHYVHVSAGKPPLTAGASGVAEWHSDPVRGTAIQASSFAAQLVERRAGMGLLSAFNGNAEGTNSNNQFPDFWRLCESFHRKAFGVVQLKAQVPKP